MNTLALGKRVERLLALALPIAAFCLFVSLLMLASVSHNTRSDASQLRSAQYLVERLRPELDRFYSESRRKPALPPWERHRAKLDIPDYKLYEHVRTYDESIVAISSAVRKFGSSDELTLSVLRNDRSPEEILKIIQERLRAIEEKILFGEVALPAKPTLSLFGASVTVTTQLLASAGYFVCCLALTIWCGALQLTRRREALKFLLSHFRAPTFPHLLNNFSVLLVYEAKFATAKAVRWQIAIKKLVFAIVRTALIGMLVALTVGPLVYSTLIMTLDFHNGTIGRGLPLPFTVYALAIIVPCVQLLALWGEEMIMIVLTPIAVVVRDRDF